MSNYVDDNNGIPTQHDLKLFDNLLDLEIEANWLNEHLIALSEMKVVYLFKNVEITIKYLIHKAYPEIDTRDFFQWNNINSYFKSINIKISDFNGYTEVNELRKVNNNIKHKNIINEEITKIKEFIGERQFTYQNLDDFVIRIKPKVQNFIKLLGDAIINDLYFFDNNRIKMISDNFKSRMDSQTLHKLTTELINNPMD
ncbi:hypothetical protein ABE545_23975 [Sphingobacterium faecium]|uniref:hypothetical protein n=1 Tax=Sphingobacterium faecium TaxID=34087 RepID=UPI0032098F54